METKAAAFVSIAGERLTAAQKIKNQLKTRT